MQTNDIHIELPTSKSISNRWLLVQHYTGGKIQIANLSSAHDTQLLKSLLEQLRSHSSTVFDCQDAGTVVRFLLPLLCVTKGSWLLTGDERLSQRPMQPLIEALRNIGCNITCMQQEGYLPLQVVGCTPSKNIAEIDPSASSQFVSGMLLMGASLSDGLTLNLTSRPISQPYIQITLNVLQHVGVPLTLNKRGRELTIGSYPTTQRHRVQVERDWSAASYFYLASLLLPNTKLRLKGLSLKSQQGDSATAKLFALLGVDTTEVRSPYNRGTSLRIECRREATKRLDINMSQTPDLVPTIVVACAAIGISCRIRGIEVLRYKECDRLAALETELQAMGANIRTTADSLMLRRSTLHPTQPVHTYNDHRIAMAFAPLRLKFPDLQIIHPEVVNKSFPTFWEQLQHLQNCISK